MVFRQYTVHISVVLMWKSVYITNVFMFSPVVASFFLLPMQCTYTPLGWLHGLYVVIVLVYMILVVWSEV